MGGPARTVDGVEQRCVGAVITDESGRIVVIRRGHPPSEGSWSIPGGRVEGAESLPDAVRREVREETGLEVDVGRILGHVTLPGPADATYAVTDFACRTRGDPSPVAGDDAADARWVTPQEFTDLPLSPGLADTLRRWGVLD